MSNHELDWLPSCLSGHTVEAVPMSMNDSVLYWEYKPAIGAALECNTVEIL